MKGQVEPTRLNQRAPSDAESSTFISCRRQIHRISNASGRKRWLNLRSEAGCRAAPNSNLGRWAPHLWREPRAAGWGGLCIGPNLLRSRRAALGSHLLSGQGYHTSADRLRGAIGATQKTLQSLSCRGQYGCSVVKGVPPAPDCPCIALASCLARAAHGLTDPHVHAQTTSEFLKTAGAFCSSGGQGSWPALGGQLACS